jgi:hypothetical protein
VINGIVYHVRFLNVLYVWAKVRMRKRTAKVMAAARFGMYFQRYAPL